MRTLILLCICASFVGAALLDGWNRKPRKQLVSDATVAFVLGVAFCWFLVYGVGIFDNWQSPWR